MPGRETRWYDGQNRPFDFMTAVWRRGAHGMEPKPREQLEQERAIIVANGGRFFAWDNPTKESGLDPGRMALLGDVVAPFLRARQPWCLNSERVPVVSLLNSAHDSYAATNEIPVCFRRPGGWLHDATKAPWRSHLDYELVSDAPCAQRHPFTGPGL